MICRIFLFILSLLQLWLIDALFVVMAQTRTNLQPPPPRQQQHAAIPSPLMVKGINIADLLSAAQYIQPKRHARRWSSSSSVPPSTTPTAHSTMTTPATMTSMAHMPMAEKTMHVTRSAGSFTRHPRPSASYGDRSSHDDTHTAIAAAADSNSSSNGTSNISSGAVSGAIIGGLVFAMLVIGAIITYRRHRRKKVEERFNADLWGVASTNSTVAINNQTIARSSDEYYSSGKIECQRKSISSRSGFHSNISNHQQLSNTSNFEHCHYPTRPPPPPPPSALPSGSSSSPPPHPSQSQQTAAAFQSSGGVARAASTHNNKPFNRLGNQQKFSSTGGGYTVHPPIGDYQDTRLDTVTEQPGLESSSSSSSPASVASLSQRTTVNNITTLLSRKNNAFISMPPYQKLMASQDPFTACELESSNLYRFPPPASISRLSSTSDLYTYSGVYAVDADYDFTIDSGIQSMYHNHHHHQSLSQQQSQQKQQNYNHQSQQHQPNTIIINNDTIPQAKVQEIDVKAVAHRLPSVIVSPLGTGSMKYASMPPKKYIYYADDNSLESLEPRSRNWSSRSTTWESSGYHFDDDLLPSSVSTITAQSFIEDTSSETTTQTPENTPYPVEPPPPNNDIEPCTDPTNTSVTVATDQHSIPFNTNTAKHIDHV
ncbi:hypothetical protein BDF19DRAFT_39132 [Syncephalis fuscata]|nr:hypothetical protein BDF19DRAFT_39132 [Syncephalis fuscata]